MKKRFVILSQAIATRVLGVVKAQDENDALDEAEVRGWVDDSWFQPCAQCARVFEIGENDIIAVEE